MEVTLRRAAPADVPTLGRIHYEAFRGIQEPHGFWNPAFINPEASSKGIRAMVANPGIYGVVAERDGRILGSNFLDERDPVRGIGPITVDPNTQNRGVGRLLMSEVLDRAAGAVSVRLVQESFHMRSLSLYTTLHFDVKEPLLVMGGKPRTQPLPEVRIRPLELKDVEECGALCRRVHKFERTAEVRDAVTALKPFVAVRNGTIVAYTTEPTNALVGHAAAASNDEMKALLVGVSRLTSEPLSFFVPIRNSELFRWCLSEGLRSMSPMNLMSIGEYQEPRGSWLPSVIY
jgi:GNAT superfamily N-acetyltransferase